MNESELRNLFFGRGFHIYIYVITNSATGKVYIGQHKGTNLKQYLQKKLYDASKGRGGASRLYNSMRKHQKEVWSIEPLFEGIQTKENLDRLERLLIALFDTRNPEIGYNICRGGEGFTGKHTAKSKAKMSEAWKAWYADPSNSDIKSSKAKSISETLTGRGNESVSKACPICSADFSLPYYRRRVVFCSQACFRRSSKWTASEQKRQNAQRVAMKSPTVRAAISSTLKGRPCDEKKKATLAGGNHRRWHVDRGVVSANCPYCSAGSALPYLPDPSAVQPVSDLRECRENRSIITSQ